MDKAKCEWLNESQADSKEGGSLSGMVASTSHISGASSSHHESHASVEALQEIAEAIWDVQCGHEEHL